MKNFLLLLSIPALILLTSTSGSHPYITNDSNVYICNSTGATKYHCDKNCRGLSNCKSDILKVTKQEAFDKGKKTLCGWED